MTIAITSWTLKLEDAGNLRCAERPRIKSMLTTIFGDVVSVHGGTVNLASLIKLAADFGATERNVRTAVHRLTNEHWLTGKRLGRTSHYSLSPQGHERFDAAQHRVYDDAKPASGRRWTIILAPMLSTDDRETLFREMSWFGFAKAGASMLIHIGDDHGSTETVLGELGLRDAVLVFHADCLMTDTTEHRSLLWKFADENWGLDAVKDRYQAFLRTFNKLADSLDRGLTLSGADSLKARLLLIHEYRRVLLHDPDLPSYILPTHWNGHQARELCAFIYRALAPASEAETRSHFQTAAGDRLPAASARFWKRFGGIKAPARNAQARIKRQRAASEI